MNTKGMRFLSRITNYPETISYSLEEFKLLDGKDHNTLIIVIRDGIDIGWSTVGNVLQNSYKRHARNGTAIKCHKFIIPKQQQGELHEPI